MSEAEKINGVAIEVTPAMLELKFNSENLRKKMTKLLSDQELHNYLEEILLKPCNKAIKSMPYGSTRDFVIDATDVAQIWYNLRINMMYNALQRAFVEWMDHGKNIDEELENTLTLDFAKHVVDILRVTMLSMIERSDEVEAQFYEEEDKVEFNNLPKSEKKYLN